MASGTVIPCRSIDWNREASRAAAAGGGAAAPAFRCRRLALAPLFLLRVGDRLQFCLLAHHRHPADGDAVSAARKDFEHAAVLPETDDRHGSTHRKGHGFIVGPAAGGINRGLRRRSGGRRASRVTLPGQPARFLKGGRPADVYRVPGVIRGGGAGREKFSAELPRTGRMVTVVTERPVAILGAGNIGAAIGRGLKRSGRFTSASITLTRRKAHLLDDFKGQGFIVTDDNRRAVRDAHVVIVAVAPQQINGVLDEIGPELIAGRHLVVSVVSGVSIGQILARLGRQLDVVRAMPNTAIAIGASMTCLASSPPHGPALQEATALFAAVGTTLVIDEDQMLAATALGACGVAFFLRAIRAASQGGIEIGLHCDEALAMAAQTAREPRRSC